jgi:hypothetical protein
MVYDECGAADGMKIGRGNQTCPNATSSTTNPTWPDLGSNPGRRGGEPATNSLSYGTALRYPLTMEIFIYIIR